MSGFDNLIEDIKKHGRQKSSMIDTVKEDGCEHFGLSYNELDTCKTCTSWLSCKHISEKEDIK
jgi:hypothetical protein